MTHPPDIALGRGHARLRVGGVCTPCSEGRHSTCSCDFGQWCTTCKAHADANGPFAPPAPDDLPGDGAA